MINTIRETVLFTFDLEIRNDIATSVSEVVLTQIYQFNSRFWKILCKNFSLHWLKFDPKARNIFSLSKKLEIILPGKVP